MARPLRIERPGGRYRVTARGNERKAVYRNDADRFHFLELLSEATERFALRIHAYVLMDNHFHLMLETPVTGVASSTTSCARKSNFLSIFPINSIASSWLPGGVLLRAAPFQTGWMARLRAPGGSLRFWGPACPVNSGSRDQTRS
jgi:REP element-mobilizing transposase RayT